jgi:phosphate starvation-inducible PhoH-like protein
MNEITIHFDNSSEAHDIAGQRIDFLSKIESTLEVKLTARDRWLQIRGSEANMARAARFIECLRSARRRGVWMPNQGLHFALEAFRDGREEELESLYQSPIALKSGKTSIFPRTFGQRAYVEAIRENDICFGIGPAGTGKTYLAMALAVSALVNHEVSRIILTRPAIEAGETLGFLPGDMRDKVSPYLRPLYDALYDMLEADDVNRYMDRGIIEVAPLAYMRGRTLNHAFVILDEAQNTTPEQMLMFLTRLGFDSRCVVTGDLTQVDLPTHKVSGLLEARKVLHPVKGIAFIQLTDHDVVRHTLVQKIIQAYRSSRGQPEKPPSTPPADNKEPS